ncbi:hypothetical protein I6I99_11015 [Sphingobacterium multivorum]|nr:hypothetical protein [Sphingobacterium multivorum]QQT33057.1 hypothetical protein I6I99_11015 [Sphingobacterium multivorum]
MKKIWLIVILLLLHGQLIKAQEGGESVLEQILKHYSPSELQKFNTLVKTNGDDLTNYLNGYLSLAEKVKLYGGGLNRFLYRMPNDNETEIGLCQGWAGNFFFMKKKNDFNSTEYIKTWEIGSSKIINENGSQFILIYPREGKRFEKRTWLEGSSDTRDGEIDVIKFYIDWDQEEGLINTLNNNFNAIGRFNKLL